MPEAMAGEGHPSHAGCGASSSMPQVDFAPSMAALMGVPIPFGNIGHISKSLWDVAHSSSSTDAKENQRALADHDDTWQSTYAAALSKNAAQVVCFPLQPSVT